MNQRHITVHVLITLMSVLGAVSTDRLVAQELPPPAYRSLPWVRLGGPSGGLGYDIRMRPDNPDVMYVTDSFAGVHMSTDGGKTWVTANEGIDSRTGPSGDAIPVFCLTIDPNSFDTIWAGLQDLGLVYRSADGGRTWERRSNGIVEGRGLSFRGITIEPGNSNVVYAAGEIASWKWSGKEMLGRQFDRTKGVVYKTTDGGLHWAAIWRGDNLARYVWIDPNDHNVLYVSTGIFDREAANTDPEEKKPGGVGIFRSHDGGKTWFPINNGLGNLYVGTLFMHPTDSNVLLAGVGNNAWYPGGGIYLTTDGGAHWQHVGGSEITSVEFASSAPRIAYAGGEEDQFFRSEDGGRTWTKLTRAGGKGWGPDGIRPGFPIDFQVDPRNPDRIFANNYSGGNFLSEDGGRSWVSASTGYTGADISQLAVVPKDPAVIFASGPFSSVDVGRTWKGLNWMNVPGCWMVAVDPANPAHLLLSSNEGAVWESLNSGLRWAMVLDLGPEIRKQAAAGKMNLFQGLWAVAFAPSNPRKVYGGFAVSTCVRFGDPEPCRSSPVLVSLATSEDGGHSWRRCVGTPLDGSTVVAITVHPSDPNIAWSATPARGIFKTTDGGASWRAVSASKPDGIVLTMTADPRNPNVLYIGLFGDGVFKSENGGTTWKRCSAGMDPNEAIGTIVIDPSRSNVVYAGSWTSGVYASEDGAKTWRRINEGLRTRSVHALAISADGGTLYAGTRGEGVFRLGEPRRP